MNMEYPFRECLHCDGIEDCHHLEVETDGFGTPKLPDECPRKDLYEESIIKKDNARVQSVIKR